MFILVFLFISLAIGTIGTLIYFISSYFLDERLKENKKRITIAYFSLLLLLSFYITYNAFYPEESFYADEFKTVTQRELPKSAIFLEKSSSYPDFHGDYCSSSQILLSKEDFRKLFDEINNDTTILKSNQIIVFSAFDKTSKSYNKKIKYSFTRKIPNKEDHHLTIEFCDDGQTIFINICIT